MAICGFFVPICIITVSYLMITKCIQEHYNNLKIRIFNSQVLLPKSGDSKQAKPKQSSTSIKLRNTTVSNKPSSISTSLLPPVNLKHHLNININQAQPNFKLNAYETANVLTIQKRKTNRKANTNRRN